MEIPIFKSWDGIGYNNSYYNYIYLLPSISEKFRNIFLSERNFMFSKIISDNF